MRENVEICKEFIAYTVYLCCCVCVCVCEKLALRKIRKMENSSSAAAPLLQYFS